MYNYFRQLDRNYLMFLSTALDILVNLPQFSFQASWGFFWSDPKDLSLKPECYNFFELLDKQIKL